MIWKRFYLRDGKEGEENVSQTDENDSWLKNLH